MRKDNILGLGSIKKRDNINNNTIMKSAFFTRSRILFLIVVFIVMLMPLLYRKLSFLLI